MSTGFFWNERCFWHDGAGYAARFQTGGLVQPMVAGGLPETPESKRRLKNLLDVTGLMDELDVRSAPAASDADLARVHTPTYLAKFKEMSKTGGGEIGLRAPFAQDGYQIAAQSAGLAKGALQAVLAGDCKNAYALTRPPGHHCLPDFPNGFCLLANIAIATEAALAEGLCKKVAIVDWDVHHGNGTEAIFYDRDDVLTISLHQDRSYPLDTGALADRGAGAGVGYNLNIPLPAGVGHATYIEAMEKLVQPALADFGPDVIIVACGYDPGIDDPLGRMLCTVETFREMTAQMMRSADDLCDGRLVVVHEGGYSESYVPFCGHAVIEQMSGSKITAPDPLAESYVIRQPLPRVAAFFSQILDEMKAEIS